MDTPNSWLASCNLSLTMLCLAALYVFGPPGSPLFILAFSVLHWPADLLRWLYVGGPVDALWAPIVDDIFAACGGHTWIVSVLLVVGAAGFAVWAESRRGSLMMFVMFLLCAPLVSQMWSGLFLARAGVAWQQSGGDEDAVIPELIPGVAFAPSALDRSTIHRVVHGASHGAITYPRDDAELKELRRRIDETTRRTDQIRSDTGLTTDQARVLLMSTVMFHLAAERMFEVAAHGLGGDPRQAWRTITLPGPAGADVQISTNLLAPPRMFHMSSEVVRERLAKRPPQAVEIAGFEQFMAGHLDAALTTTTAVEADTGSVFAPVTSGAVVQYHDIMVSAWMTAVLTYHATRGTLARIAPGLALAQADRWGALKIRIVNDRELFRRVSAGRHVGNGFYDATSNTVHVVVDEQAFWRARARRGLSQTLAELTRDERIEVPAYAWSLGRDRFLLHELVHWSLQASLSASAEPMLTACMDEGWTTFAEMMVVSYPQDGFAIDAKDRELAQRNDPREWMHRWLEIREHRFATPAETALESESSFYAHASPESYAECWAFSMLFGDKILARAAATGQTAAVVIRTDPALKDLLARPWTGFQAEIRASGGEEWFKGVLAGGAP